MDDWCAPLSSFAEAQQDYVERQHQACVKLLARHHPDTVEYVAQQSQPECVTPDVSFELARCAQIGEIYFEIAAKRLLWQLGGEAPPPAGAPYLRRLRSSASTDVRGPYEYANDVSQELVTRLEFMTVVRPCPGLFQDLLPPWLYPHEGESLGSHLTEEAVVEALRRLKNHSLLARLIQTISPFLVIVPALPVERRQSFNCRLTYPGVMFLGLQQEPADTAADIVHEFIHQLLWLAAWKSPSDWLPVGLDADIQSPVTSRRKNAAVMVHACLIYSLLYELRHVIGLSGGRAAEFASASENLQIQLEGIPQISSYRATMQVLRLAGRCREQ